MSLQPTQIVNEAMNWLSCKNSNVYTNKLVSVLPVLLALKRYKNWDINDDIISAINFETERKQTKLSKAKFIANRKISKRKILVWKALDLPQKKFKTFIQKYFEGVESNIETDRTGGGMFAEKVMKPEQLLEFLLSKSTLSDFFRREFY